MKIMFLISFFITGLLAEEATLYESRCIVNKNGRVVFSGKYATRDVIVYSQRKDCPEGYVEKSDLICNIENLDRKTREGFKRFKGECK